MMFWFRQLLSCSNRTRTHHARAALVHTLQQQPLWPHPGGRYFSTGNHTAATYHPAEAAAPQATLQAALAHHSSTVDPAGLAAASAADDVSTGTHHLLSSLSSAPDTTTSLSHLLDTAVPLSSFAAAQPLEPLQHLLNPVVLGCSAWEMVHSVTGLPWWASIPLTTLALRTLLLPLTLKAKAAGLNFVLAQQATYTATNLIEHWKQQQAAQQAAGGAGGGSSASSGSGGGPGGSSSALSLGRGEELKRPSRWRIFQTYYRYYRKQHHTTSLWWWSANVFVQLNTFLGLSLALRQMSAAQWPGFTEQGLWWFTDLTHSTVQFGTAATGYLSGAHCPYGFAGFLLPFSLVVLYNKTVRDSPLARQSQPVQLLLDMLLLPYLWVSCVDVPVATLLYWLTNATFFWGLQTALGSPRVATALNLPLVALPPPQQTKDARERAELEAFKAQQLVCGSEDDGFLRYLAASYLSRGLHQQALQCLTRLTVLAPGDADAFRALGTTAAELQQWPLSARAFERAAELHAVAVDRREHVQCLMLAAKQWLNATAEARAMQKRARQQGGSGAPRQQQQQQQQMQVSAAAEPGGAAGSSSVGGSSSSSSSRSDHSGASVEDKAAVTVQPDQQQEYINSALALLQQAIHFQDDGAADAYYLLSMAQAADGKWEPSFEAATTFWSRSLVLAENDQTARINAAAKLLPVLNNLCKQRCKHKDYGALLTVAQLAVEVAKCGWDRQTEEQLRDTLGAAAQAAGQQGKHISQQIYELQQQLPCGVGRPLR